MGAATSFVALPPSICSDFTLAFYALAWIAYGGAAPNGDGCYFATTALGRILMLNMRFTMSHNRSPCYYSGLRKKGFKLTFKSKHLHWSRVEKIYKYYFWCPISASRSPSKLHSWSDTPIPVKMGPLAAWHGREVWDYWKRSCVAKPLFFSFFFYSFLASETLASILYRSGIFRGQSKGTCSVQSTGEYGWTSKGHLKVAMAVVATF